MPAQPVKFGQTRKTRYVDLSDQVKRVVDSRVRAYVSDAASEIRDGIVAVIDESGPSGRAYEDPEVGVYRASAPGQPPATRTSQYRDAWRSTDAVVVDGRIKAFVYNPLRVDFIPLWLILEFGRVKERKRSARKPGSSRGGAAGPRPHVEQGANRALIAIRGHGFRHAA